MILSLKVWCPFCTFMSMYGSKGASMDVQLWVRYIKNQCKRVLRRHVREDIPIYEICLITANPPQHVVSYRIWPHGPVFWETIQRKMCLKLFVKITWDFKQIKQLLSSPKKEVNVMKNKSHQTLSSTHSLKTYRKEWPFV